MTEIPRAEAMVHTERRLVRRHKDGRLTVVGGEFGPDDAEWIPLADYERALDALGKYARPVWPGPPGGVGQAIPHWEEARAVLRAAGRLDD